MGKKRAYIKFLNVVMLSDWFELTDIEMLQAKIDMIYDILYVWSIPNYEEAIKELDITTLKKLEELYMQLEFILKTASQR